MTDRHLRVHRLWILVEPTGGVLYVLGESASEAWRNGISWLYGHNLLLDRFTAHKLRMRKEGWRARPIQFEVDVKELPR